MTFAQPWVLIFLALIAVWAFIEWGPSNRRVVLAVKALTCALIFLALSEPSLTLFERQPAIALLGDGSASIPTDQRTGIREFADQASGVAGDAVCLPSKNPKPSPAGRISNALSEMALPPYQRTESPGLRFFPMGGRIPVPSNVRFT